MPEQLPSSAERRFRDLKHELTLQVFLREGPFWEAVSALRKTWRIEPPSRVPVAGDGLRPVILEHPDPSHAADPLRARLDRKWRDAVHGLHDDHVPVAFWRGDRGGSRLLWFSFLANCVLLDPPGTHLTEFAAAGNSMTVGFGEIDPRTVDMETWKVAPPPADPMMMVGAPVVRWPHPDTLVDAEREFWLEILAELGRRLAIDVFAEVNALLRETDLKGRAMGRYAALPASFLVAVDPDTTKEDVYSAFRMIAAAQPERTPEGRPRLDRLTAVQCAFLKQHGLTDPEIAERFGWALRRDAYDKRRRSNAVINHVKLGRQILAGRKNPSG